MGKSNRGREHLSWQAVLARRLNRQGLSEPWASATPADIVAAMCGAHAQVMSAAEWSIGLRLASVSRSSVRDALWRGRSLVKTFGPRGTIHLLPTRDLPMWTAALAALPPAPSPFAEGVRLNEEETDAVVEAMGSALADTELTQDELGAAIIAKAGAWAGERTVDAFQDKWPRWRLGVYAAARRGILCFGENRGRSVTYTSPRRLVPDFVLPDREVALTELVRRYLHAYGPATPAHFAQWLSAPRGWAADLFAGMADIEEVAFTDGSGWIVSDDVDPPDAAPVGARLLPYFDAYTIGSHPRDRVFPGAAKRALAGGQAGNFPVLLVGGVVAGIWQQKRSGKKLAITVEPFGKLTAADRRAIGDEVERLGAFLEAKPELAFGTVTTGAHA